VVIRENHFRYNKSQIIDLTDDEGLNIDWVKAADQNLWQFRAIFCLNKDSMVLDHFTDIFH